MNCWGQRYVELGLFISYCRAVGLETSRQELERYEEIGVMPPVARVVYPAEYVMQIHGYVGNGATDLEETDQWPRLSRLTEKIRVPPYDYIDLTDEELIHCFDREMDSGGNPHLIRPDQAGFQPWCTYRLAVVEGDGVEIGRPTAQHYYCYWQIHQLYDIQRYPDLYKNAALIELVPKDHPMGKHLPRAPKKEVLADFRGMRKGFDALSFWIVLEQRERNRTFADIPDVHGVRRLDDGQADAYRNRLASHARMVTDRFGMDRQELYRFLSRLIEIYEKYERDERQRLTVELKNDILACEDLVALRTDQTRDTIADELGRLSLYDKETFLRLDVIAKERERALSVLNIVSAECSETLSRLDKQTGLFAEAEGEEIIDYCYKEGMGLLPTALSGFVASGEEERHQNFRRVQRYSNLKNVLTSYEYVLKSLMERPGLSTGGETLTQLVSTAIRNETWYGAFDEYKKQGLLTGKNSQEFLGNLVTLLDDRQLKESADGYWAQQFLITCLARNMAVHSYPKEDSYYGDQFGTMLNAVVSATFYTWQLSKANAWT